MLLETSPSVVTPTGLLINSCLSSTCVYEGDHLTRVLQRCWPVVERGRPGPYHITLLRLSHDR